jgi:hypothetical protein
LNQYPSAMNFKEYDKKSVTGQSIELFDQRATVVDPNGKIKSSKSKKST